MKKIGMIIPTTDNSFFSNLAHEAEQYLYGRGYQLLISDVGHQAEKEKEYLESLSKITEGMIDISGLSELPKGILPEDYPLVFVDRHPVSERKVPWVANDDTQAMEEATAFLIEKGCRNILLLPGYIAEQHENPRIVGYKRALERAGMDFEPAYVLKRRGLASSEAETSELVMQIMKQGKKVDGIITSSDRAAFGAMKALGKAGYYVPEDVKLISFDNSPYAMMSSPSITSIDRNVGELSKAAGELLLQCIYKECAVEKKIVPVSLVKRDSTR